MTPRLWSARRSYRVWPDKTWEVHLSPEQENS